MTRVNHFQVGAGVDVPISNYGVEVVPAYRERELRKWYQGGKHVDKVKQVPINQIKAGQETVDSHKVSQFASKPLEGHATGVELPENEEGGVMLEDGHHRLAAAKVRGDTHMTVHITFKHGTRVPGTEGRW